MHCAGQGRNVVRFFTSHQETEHPLEDHVPRVPGQLSHDLDMPRRGAAETSRTLQDREGLLDQAEI